jgi:hypothetical protein
MRTHRPAQRTRGAQSGGFGRTVCATSGRTVCTALPAGVKCLSGVLGGPFPGHVPEQRHAQSGEVRHKVPDHDAPASVSSIIRREFPWFRAFRYVTAGEQQLA